MPWREHVLLLGCLVGEVDRLNEELVVGSAGADIELDDQLREQAARRQSCLGLIRACFLFIKVLQGQANPFMFVCWF